MVFLMRTLEDNVKTICSELSVPEPIEFLTQVMAGHDPRQLSDIYQMVLKIEEEHGEHKLPDEWDYVELVYKIKERYQFFPVQLSESHTAAKQIMEYTHAKKKQVEHGGHILDSNAVQPLTEDEIEIFLEKFDERY